MPRARRAAPVVLAAVLGATMLSRPAQASPNPIGAHQIAYDGQLPAHLTGKYPVVLRLYGERDAVLHEETVTVDVKDGKFQASAGAQTDLTGALRDAQSLRIFFQGDLVDAVALIHAADPAPNAPTDRRSIVVAPEASTPVVAPRALGGTCTLQSTMVSFSNSVTASVPACSTGVMVSAGYKVVGGFIVTQLVPTSALNQWTLSAQFALQPQSGSVTLYGICCP